MHTGIVETKNYRLRPVHMYTCTQTPTCADIYIYIYISLSVHRKTLGSKRVV